MWAILARFFEWAVKGSVKTALLGAGLGIGSATISITIFRQYLNQLQFVANNVVHDSLALLALSGGDVALSAIIGAIITRITMNATKLTLTRMRNE